MAPSERSVESVVFAASDPVKVSRPHTEGETSSSDIRGRSSSSNGKAAVQLDQTEKALALISASPSVSSVLDRLLRDGYSRSEGIHQKI